MGTTTYPLSEQIGDTIRTHGANFAIRHYMEDRRGPRLPYWMFAILCGFPDGLTLR